MYDTGIIHWLCDYGLLGDIKNSGWMVPFPCFFWFYSVFAYFDIESCCGFRITNDNHISISWILFCFLIRLKLFFFWEFMITLMEFQGNYILFLSFKVGTREHGSILLFLCFRFFFFHLCPRVRSLPKDLVSTLLSTCDMSRLQAKIMSVKYYLGFEWLACWVHMPITTC